MDQEKYLNMEKAMVEYIQTGASAFSLQMKYQFTAFGWNHYLHLVQEFNPELYHQYVIHWNLKDRGKILTKTFKKEL